MSADLAGFLTAQLDEIERVARAATPGPWEWDGEEFKDAPSGACPHGTEWAHHGPDLESLSAREYGYRATVISASGYDASSVNVRRADAAHIALHDPAFVLAWVAALRQVVAELVPEVSRLDDVYEGEAGPGDPRISDALLRALARPFRGRPGWRDEWDTGNGG